MRIKIDGKDPKKHIAIWRQNVEVARAKRGDKRSFKPRCPVCHCTILALNLSGFEVAMIMGASPQPEQMQAVLLKCADCGYIMRISPEKIGECEETSISVAPANALGPDGRPLIALARH